MLWDNLRWLFRCRQSVISVWMSLFLFASLFACFPQVDVILFREFLQWMDERSVSHDQPFLARIYQEDVLSCLNFPNKEVHHYEMLHHAEGKLLRETDILKWCWICGDPVVELEWGTINPCLIACHVILAGTNWLGSCLCGPVFQRIYRVKGCSQMGFKACLHGGRVTLQGELPF